MMDRLMRLKDDETDAYIDQFLRDSYLTNQVRKFRFFNARFPHYAWNEKHYQHVLKELSGYRLDFDDCVYFLDFFHRRGFRPDKTILLQKYVHQPRIFDWLLKVLKIKPDRSLANWFAQMTPYSDALRFEGLFFLYDTYGLIPTCLIKWNYGLNQIYNYFRYADFAQFLKVSQNKIMSHSLQHNRIVDVCMAFFPLFLPSYILLEMIDWSVTGPMTHFQKITLIVKINETHRRKIESE
jgi:hypothetical protein